MLFDHSGSRDPLASSSAHRPDRGWRSLALAVLFALASLPTAVWAGGPGPNGAHVARASHRATPATDTRDAKTAQQQAYAAREASATEQAKFEGGSTIWIGGSTLVVVLLVILIVILV